MGCIASLACTACTCCARATCCCCRLGGRAAGRAVGGGGDKEGRRRFSRRQRSVCAKVTYLVLLCLMVLVGVFVRLVGPDIYRDFYSFNTGCEGDATELDRCLSLFGAYRYQCSCWPCPIVSHPHPLICSTLLYTQSELCNLCLLCVDRHSCATVARKWGCV